MKGTLTNCPRCGGKISPEAFCCPHCGHLIKPPEQLSSIKDFLLVVGTALTAVGAFFALIFLLPEDPYSLGAALLVAFILIPVAAAILHSKLKRLR